MQISLEEFLINNINNSTFVSPKKLIKLSLVLYNLNAIISTEQIILGFFLFLPTVSREPKAVKTFHISNKKWNTLQ